MRSFSHWTPNYIYNRVAVWAYEKKHPAAPWLTADCIRLLNSLLKANDIGFEWGSGRSTLWLAKKISSLTSVEHDMEWYKKVKDRLSGENIKNVTLIHSSLEGDGDSPYVRAISGVKDASLDFALVDGRLRDFCILAALPKIKPGGMLIVDNINEYIAGGTIVGSQPFPVGASADHWAQTKAILEKHRSIWTSNGIWDTAVYFVGSK